MKEQIKEYLAARQGKVPYEGPTSVEEDAPKKKAEAQVQDSGEEMEKESRVKRELVNLLKQAQGMPGAPMPAQGMPGAPMPGAPMPEAPMPEAPMPAAPQLSPEVMMLKEMIKQEILAELQGM